MARPRLVVSKCLGFEACRYDGSIIPNPVVDALREFADFIPVCPEVEIGLGVPRPSLRLVQQAGAVRLLQPATGRDLTEEMETFSRRFLESLPPVDGFILKGRSPSCGIKDAKVYAGTEKSPVVTHRSGVFGGLVRVFFPTLPVEDDGRLTNREIREHFYTAIFALAALREVGASGRMGDLVRFHTRYKFLLMALSQKHLKRLGLIVANLEHRPFEEVIAQYTLWFQAALARPPRRPSVFNVLMHAFGYFSDRLSKGEKTHFLDLLDAYRKRIVPLSTPVSLLRSWIVRFEEPYLADQAFFQPFPEALISPADTGRGA